MDRVKIIVDAMGGDNAPRSVVEGAVLGAKEYGTDLVFTGDENAIRGILRGLDTDGIGIEVVPAASVVTMEDSPAVVQKEKKDSSMVVGCELLREGRGDAFISSGNTGALFTAATLYVKRHKGVRRAALGAIVNCGKPFMIVDSGANTDVTPEILVKFAFMGSLYFSELMGVKEPRVALINNGSEECKGTEIYREAYTLLKNSSLNFVGNCEGRDLPNGFCDVAVCDGFTGNVTLKLMEGMGQFFLGSLKDIYGKNIKNKLAYLLVSRDFRAFKGRIDHKQYGGAPFLGIAKPVIKSHGSAEETSIKATVRQARDYVLSGLNEKIAEGMAEDTKTASENIRNE